MSFCAFSAKVGQSDAPSSITGSSRLPRTPPAALTSSIASSSAFFTVTSLMAIVPLREWRIPTLTVSPPEDAVAPPAPDSPPQAVRVSIVAVASETSPNRDFLCTYHSSRVEPETEIRRVQCRDSLFPVGARPVKEALSGPVRRRPRRVGEPPAADAFLALQEPAAERRRVGRERGDQHAGPGERHDREALRRIPLPGRAGPGEQHASGAPRAAEDGAAGVRGGLRQPELVP